MTAVRRGRPRKIHSKLLAGVGRELNASERGDALEIAKDCGWDDESDPAALLDRISEACALFHATDGANRARVAAAGENADLEAILIESEQVREMLVTQQEARDQSACVAWAGRLARRFVYFPNSIAANLTHELSAEEILKFHSALQRLSESLVGVRHWHSRRSMLVDDLDAVVAVCRAAPAPAGFTKREKSGHAEFKRELKKIYLELIQPERLRNFREIREAHGDRRAPPLHSAETKFAEAIAEALAVRREPSPKKRRRAKARKPKRAAG